MTDTRAALNVTRIADSDQTTRSLVMLHGIFGRGRNWQGIARALTAARPEYACWLVDLPHHGESGPGAHGDTVRGLAADVADWLKQSSISPDAVLGHSYGGKVALAMSADLSAQPLQIWVIDSTPEPKAPGGSAWSMLEIVRTSPGPFRSRDEAVAAVTAGGFTLGVAQWMATNLARTENGFVWRLDFNVMETLMRDFFEVDLWPVIEHLPADHEIHFLKASESSAMSDEAAVRVERLASGRVHLHRRQGGHWIHAESPDVVTALLVEQLPR